MKIEQAITILKEHNKWRRGTPPYDEVGNRQPYSAKDIGLAIDCVVEHFANTKKMVDIDKACKQFNYILAKVCDPMIAESFQYDFRCAMEVETCNSDKNLQGLVWHKVADGDLPKDRVFLAHCVGMGKGFVDRVCWNKRNGGFDNLNDIPPYASIKESHLDEYYDWWMEIPELPKED